ncbi:MAG: hypothetical protein KME06_17310 [Kastovskya adunca ATA6-11-RM4]|nr:hypothetical protein [Kastovskya adunca ATA6-11-RM4]
MVQESVSQQQQNQIRCAGLPLAVYREVAAHLRQVPGVETGLVPQTSRQFDYSQSQIGSLWIQYGSEVAEAERQQVAEILAYYQNRYGAWQEDNSPH